MGLGQDSNSAGKQVKSKVMTPLQPPNDQVEAVAVASETQPPPNARMIRKCYNSRMIRQKSFESSSLLDEKSGNKNY